MLRMDLQDAQWLDAVSPVLDIYFEKDHRSHKRLNEPVRPYLKPKVWFVCKDGGFLEETPLAVAFSVDDGLAYVPYIRSEKRFAFEQARYIDKAPSKVFAAKNADRSVTFYDPNPDLDPQRYPQIDPQKELTLGAVLTPEVWQPLRDAAEGRPSPDKSHRFAPV